MTENRLAILEQADKLLAEIKTVDDARHLMARAEAARAYAKEIKMGFEVQNTAAEIKLRAQRAAGGVLDEMKKRGEYYDNRSTGYQNGRSLGVLFNDDLGISSHDSTEWQYFYRLPQHVFEEGIAQSWQPDENGRRRELTTWGLYTWAKSYGKKPTETKKVMTPLAAYEEIKKAVQVIRDNIAYLETGNNVIPGKYYLTWIVRVLTEIAVSLVKKGYGNEPTED
jgi:hypothetical protein